MGFIGISDLSVHSVCSLDQVTMITQAFIFLMHSNHFKPTQWTWFGWTPEHGDGQVGLECCGSWCR